MHTHTQAYINISHKTHSLTLTLTHATTETVYIVCLWYTVPLCAIGIRHSPFYPSFVFKTPFFPWWSNRVLKKGRGLKSWQSLSIIQKIYKWRWEDNECHTIHYTLQINDNNNCKRESYSLSSFLCHDITHDGEIQGTRPFASSSSTQRRFAPLGCGWRLLWAGISNVAQIEVAFAIDMLCFEGQMIDLCSVCVVLVTILIDIKH